MTQKKKIELKELYTYICIHETNIKFPIFKYPILLPRTMIFFAFMFIFEYRFQICRLATSFPGLQCEDEARHEEALVWAGQFCILIG
jgi:hypothetical protein